MKVLMVNKFLFPNGGSETYIFELGRQLERAGHEVQFFGMEHEGRVVSNKAGIYTSDMDFHGAGLLQKLSYPFRILYSREAKRKIRQVLEDFQPDVVHLNNINFQLTPSIIDAIREYDRSSRKKTGIVYTAHDYQWVCPNHMLRIPATGRLCQDCIDGKNGSCIKNRCIHGSLARSVFGAAEGTLYRVRKTYGEVDKIICPSAFMAQMLGHHKQIAGRLVVLHNFAPELPAARIQPEKYVLYFGRYDEEKGIRTLLDICRKLPEISFVFAGKGAMEEEVNSLPNVTNLGFLSGSRLTDTIRKAAFVVYPSEWYENCPFSIMEAIRCGTPVVAPGLGGIPELVRDQETGLVCKPLDPEDLRRTIQALWEDEKTCSRLHESCMRFRGFLSPADYTAEIIRIYQEARS